MDAGLKQLLNLIPDPDSYEGGCPRALEIRQTIDCIDITLEVTFDEGEIETWLVQCNCPVTKERLTIDQFCYGLEWFEDHPILSLHGIKRGSISFYGKVARPYELYVALLESGREVFDPLIDIREYITMPSPSLAIRQFQQGFGNIASGPRIIIDEFAKTLDRFDIDYHLLYSENDPRRLPPKIELLVAGSCYVVAESITAKKLE